MPGASLRARSRRSGDFRSVEAADEQAVALDAQLLLDRQHARARVAQPVDVDRVLNRYDALARDPPSVGELLGMEIEVGHDAVDAPERRDVERAVDRLADRPLPPAPVVAHPGSGIVLGVDDRDARGGLLRADRADRPVSVDDVEPIGAARQLLADPPADREIAGEVLRHPADEALGHLQHQPAERSHADRNDAEVGRDQHVLAVDVRDERDLVPLGDQRLRQLKCDQLGAAGSGADRENPPRGDEDAQLPPIPVASERLHVVGVDVVVALVSASFDSHLS